MRGTHIGPQRRTHRSFAFFTGPLAVLCTLVLALAYEVWLGNQPQSPDSSHVRLLGVAPTVALIATIGTALLARSQFSKITAPAVAGHTDGWSDSAHGPIWCVGLHNAGPGLARVREFVFRIGVDSDYIQDRSPESAQAYLRRRLGGEFAQLRIVSPGLPLKPLSDPDKRIEIFGLSESAMSRISHFEVLMFFDDLLGDRYEWKRDFTGVLVAALADSPDVAGPGGVPVA